MRYLLLLILLAGCAKTSAVKQREADKCWLDYGSQRMDTCLVSKYGWDSLEAYVAKVERLNAGK